MGVEVVGSEMTQVSVEAVGQVENGKLDKELELDEPIKFGSYDEVPLKGEGNDVADANFPKDAVDEWPAPKQILSFYFVRYRPYDDPKIKAKIDQLAKELQNCNQSRFQKTEELKAKRAEQAELVNQLKTLNGENKQYKTILDDKKKEIEPLQQALGKLRNTSNTGRGGICSSEEELNDLIYSLQYRIQHESIPLAEEKQILREIKQLEGTREKVIANAAMRAKIQDSLGQKEAIQDQVKLMGVDLDGVRKEQQAVWAKITRLEENRNAVKLEIDSLQSQVDALALKRDNAYNSIQELRGQRDSGNSKYYDSRKHLAQAKEYATKKDVKALEELSISQIEEFMSLWSNNKAFRDDYEKRLLPSLDSRQLSRDGRIRDPDEKPIVAVETPIVSEPEPIAKANVKRPKEDRKPSPQQDALPAQKVQKAITTTDTKTASEHIDISDMEIPGSESVQKNRSPPEKEADEEKLKEIKRGEEIVKAKQAMERKKKLAEKAAAKAAIRAQKEAEKKLKEREKKLKKKAAATTPATDPEEPAEAVAEVAEPEKVEVSDEAPVLVKGKVRKESIRSRDRTRGGADSLPKIILKRKKSTEYWMWAAPAALFVLVLLALGYYYYLL